MNTLFTSKFFRATTRVVRPGDVRVKHSVFYKNLRIYFEKILSGKRVILTDELGGKVVGVWALRFHRGEFSRSDKSFIRAFLAWL